MTDQISRRRCMGAILAGGRAARFGGRAKGLERIAGTRMIDRVARALRDSCDDVVLVANDEAASSWLPGVPVVRDRRPGTGALGGLHAALVHADDAILVLAWDAPFVPAGLLRALRDAGEFEDADAAVPLSDSAWGFEPLCAWYGPRCRPAIEGAMDAGSCAAGGWQSAVSTIRVDPSAWGDPGVLFFNVNTTDDLGRAQRLAPVPES
ncbi:MAG: molybdenum cofactor guanylyltransferase [Gemmatimonadales bacterium]